MPLYLLLVQSVPPLEFVAWRLIFTLPLCVLFLAMTRGWAELRSVLRDRRALLTLLASATMVAVNWWLYVWAIHNGQQESKGITYAPLSADAVKAAEAQILKLTCAGAPCLP